MNSPIRGFIALALVAATACAGDEGSGPAGSISISASPTATTLSQGGTGTVSVTIARTGGFAEPVTISVNGLPDGVTATVTPAQLNLTSVQAQVTLNVSESALPGTYTATVSATASGVAPASASYSLVVMARPGFALSASPAAVSIHQDESATSEIQIQRTNFPGAVAFALTSPTPGIIGQFASSPALGTSASLTVQVAGIVAPGTYVTTVVGSADGLVDRTTSLAITVTQRPDFSLSVSPANVSINAGSSGQVAVNVTRSNFTGAVALELQNLSNGFSGTFGAVTAGGATLTISVAGSVAPGTYGLTVHGTPSGFPEKTAALTITVAPQPDYALSVAPASLTLSSGATGQVTVNIQRTNFTGVINLSFDAVPNGILPSVNPAATTGSSAALSITVASTVAPGSYTLAIKGATGLPGAMDRSTTLALTVTPPPPPTEPPPPTPPPTGVGSLSATPSSFSTGPGGTVTSEVLLAGTIGPVVQFSVLAAPAGVVGTFSPTIYTSSIHATSTLTISVAANVAPGTYTLEIQGASSTLTRSTTVTVSVPAQSSFTLSVPTPGTAYQGYAYSVAVQIQRTNFSGAVSFQVVGALPAGVTHTWYQNPTTANLGILRLVIPESLPVGSYPVTVRGSAPGYPDQTVSYQLTVATLVQFAIIATPASLLTWPGGTVTTTLSVRRTNFPDDVTLSVTSDPAWPASLSTTLLSGPDATSTLTVKTPEQSPTFGAGSRTIWLRATGGGLETTASVTVSAFYTQGVDLIPNTENLIVVQGSSNSLGVTASRVNYTGPFVVVVTGAPAGMIVTHSPNPVTGDALTLTVSVNSNVPTGWYELSIAADAVGVYKHWRKFTVRVTASSGSE